MMMHTATTDKKIQMTGNKWIKKSGTRTIHLLESLRKVEAVGEAHEAVAPGLRRLLVANDLRFLRNAR